MRKREKNRDGDGKRKEVRVLKKKRKVWWEGEKCREKWVDHEERKYERVCVCVAVKERYVWVVLSGPR